MNLPAQINADQAAQDRGAEPSALSRSLRASGTSAFDIKSMLHCKNAVANLQD